MKRGFTVLEMMFALAIFALVVGSLGGTFVALRRLVGHTYAETELTMRLRALREKLLFHAEPTHDGKAYAGLLSGAPKSSQAIESGNKVYVCAQAYNLSNGKSVGQTIELVRAVTAADADAGQFVNDGALAPWRTRWLTFAGFGETDGASSTPGYLPADSYLEDRALGKNLYFINLAATVRLPGTANGVTRAERIVVPVFAAEQEKNATALFHDNLLP